MIADDSTVARKQIAKTLDRLGMKWEEACTGKEALERLRFYMQDSEETGQPLSKYVDGLLTDIEMPEMDGFSLTRHLRQDPRFVALPILMHSSLSGSCNVDKGKSVGVTDFVTKFDPKILRQKLIQYVATSAD